MIFTQPGCYIDVAYGPDHAVGKMQELLRAIDTPHGHELANDLPEDEFIGEWLFDATDELQTATLVGLVWDWEGGDLVLFKKEQHYSHQEE